MAFTIFSCSGLISRFCGWGTTALACVFTGLVIGLLVGLVIGFFLGSWWGWIFFIDQYYHVCLAISRQLRPRIQAVVNAAIEDPDVTRRFVACMETMPRPKTGIDFMRYNITPMEMVRALQHPDAPVALAYTLGREEVAAMEARLMCRIYIAHLHMTWAVGRGCAEDAERIHYGAALWMRALRELVLVRRQARAMRPTLMATRDPTVLEAAVVRFLHPNRPIVPITLKHQ